MGVTTSEHSVTGAAVSIAIGGTAKISCGENISVGSTVIPQTATGKAMVGPRSYAIATGTSAATLRTVGIALENGSTGALMEVLIMPQNVIIDTLT